MEPTEIVMNTDTRAAPPTLVVVVKLVSGEELIGVVVADGEKAITLDKLLVLGYEIDPQSSKLSFGFLPFSPMTASRKQFQYDRLIYVTEPNEKLKDAYEQATGQKRIIAPKQGLILE